MQTVDFFKENDIMNLIYYIFEWSVKQMKKISLTFVSVLLVFICSACTVNFTIDTDKKAEKTEATEKTINEEVTNANLSDEDELHAFYGVWCSGGKIKSDAENFAEELSGKGFNAQVFVTTDWKELNPEMFYVVTAGVCETKEEAEQLLISVKKEGYLDAYVKYTGERK